MLLALLRAPTLAVTDRYYGCVHYDIFVQEDAYDFRGLGIIVTLSESIHCSTYRQRQTISNHNHRVHSSPVRARLAAHANTIVVPPQNVHRPHWVRDMMMKYVAAKVTNVVLRLRNANFVLKISRYKMMMMLSI